VANVAEYLDLEAVAEMLGVDRNAAYVLVRKGEIAGVKVNVGWRVERAEVLRFIGSN
jgi:excisionase family DNA binding protein